MKITIIGSGAQGTGLAGLLSMEPDVEALTLADYSSSALEQSKKLIETLGNRILVKEINYQRVNAGDVEDVASVIQGSDVCFHAILPRFNLPIMRACLREKVHYLDLIALPGGDEMPAEESIQAQLALDEDFRKAGLLAIPSVGISPGWTLFAAAHMIDEVDTVKEVVIRWADYLDTKEFTSSINPGFMLSEWLGAPHPSAWKNNQIIGEDLLESEEEFEFPSPIGTRKIYTCTSQPDIAMIPAFSAKEIPYCVEKGSVNLGTMEAKDIWVKALQMAASAQGDSVEDGNILEAMGRTLIPPLDQDRLFQEGKIKDHATCFSVEVSGYKDGHFTRHIQYNNCTKATALKHLPWGTPAVYDTVGGLPIILILMIGRGQLTQRGVFTAGQLDRKAEIQKALLERDQDISEKIIRSCVDI